MTDITSQDSKEGRELEIIQHVSWSHFSQIHLWLADGVMITSFDRHVSLLVTTKTSSCRAETTSLVTHLSLTSVTTFEKTIYLGATHEDKSYSDTRFNTDSSVQSPNYGPGAKNGAQKYDANSDDVNSNDTIYVDKIMKDRSSDAYHSSDVTKLVVRSDDVKENDVMSGSAVFRLHTDDCDWDRYPEFSANRGVIHGLYARPNLTHKAEDCRWKISVSEGLFIFAYLEIFLDSCVEQGTIVYASDRQPVKGTHFAEYACLKAFPPVMLTGSNTLLFHLTDAVPTDQLLFKVHFESTSQHWRSKFNVVFTSSVSGYMTTPFYDGHRGYAGRMNASHLLVTPEEHVVMLSVDRLDIKGSDFLEFVNLCFDFVALYRVHSSDVTSLMWKYCSRGHKLPPIDIYFFSLLFRFESTAKSDGGSGFKATFSFHHQSQAPVKLSSGLFNCSEPRYASFKQHVHCNLEPECQGGEDEGGHCPFSSPACNGSVAVVTAPLQSGRPGGQSTHKCYTMHNTLDYRNYMKWGEAEVECRRMGESLATVETDEEWQAFRQLFQFRRRQPVYVGMKTNDPTWPFIYRNTYQWTGNTVSYRRNIMTSSVYHLESQGLVYDARRPTVLTVHSWDVKGNFGFVCQRSVTAGVPSTPRHLHFPRLTSSEYNIRNTTVTQPLVICPGRHVTHAFLSCDVKSRCKATRSVKSCPFPSSQDLIWLESIHSHTAGHHADSHHLHTGQVPGGDADTDFNLLAHAASGTVDSTSGYRHKEVTTRPVMMFVCDDRLTTLPYTLVCDFRQDCGDGSDETFCKHRQCGGVLCRNGQCIALSEWCDDVPHCIDASDLVSCDLSSWYRASIITRVPPPALVNYHPAGAFTQTPMTPSQPCPHTHFRCEPYGYCLPVYLRCNGFFDCVNMEDEAACDQYACPGFYRCRNSSVCLHPEHLCDGFPQCPQRDDEWLCGVTCPAGCRCQGLAFVCGRPFPVASFPGLRYLDARGSGVGPGDLTSSWYLVWARLANCGLTTVGNMDLPNLQSLDLSENGLTSVLADVFLALGNLLSLDLRGNPLTSLVTRDSRLVQTRLHTLDLSFLRLNSLNTSVLAGFLNLRFLNVSFSQIDTVDKRGFNPITLLTELDMRGNAAENFQRDIFQELSDLKVLFASNYRLCCKEVLPRSFEGNVCYAPNDEISSCEDLLRSDMYRAFLWLVAGLSITGNSASFVLRLLVDKGASRCSFSVFVSSLNMADLLMGVYLTIVGVADTGYRGSYLWNEQSWTRSVACKMAGFLSLLSSEVSAFIICLITLDRFIVLRFPFSRLQFRWRSAVVASSVAWVSGFVLATVPFLPVTSHWDFYSQTGICIPLPITRRVFQGHHYAFSVMIVLNFVLFVLIALGQASIFWSVRENSLITDTTRKCQEMTVARRLITVVVSNFLCWFPIGLLGIMAWGEVPVPGEVNVAMAVFVLPLNSALNPFLYTFNMLMERRRRRLEHSLMRRLRAHMVTHKADSTRLSQLSS